MTNLLHTTHTTNHELDFIDRIKKNPDRMEGYYKACLMRKKWAGIDKKKVLAKCERLMR